MVTARGLVLRISPLFFAAFTLAAEPTTGLAISHTETIRYHMTTRELERACRTRGVDACTDFVRKTFACRCEPDGAGWRLAADIHLHLSIHLARRRFLPHERAHVDDVEASLKRFFAPFLAERFDERAACEHLARTLSAPSLAADVLHDVLKASNERLGCAKKLPKGDD